MNAAELSELYYKKKSLLANFLRRIVRWVEKHRVLAFFTLSFCCFAFNTTHTCLKQLLIVVKCINKSCCDLGTAFFDSHSLLFTDFTTSLHAYQYLRQYITKIHDNTLQDTTLRNPLNIFKTLQNTCLTMQNTTQIPAQQYLLDCDVRRLSILPSASGTCYILQGKLADSVHSASFSQDRGTTKWHLFVCQTYTDNSRPRQDEQRLISVLLYLSQSSSRVSV